MTLLTQGVPGVTAAEPQTYEAFWPYYVSQHLHRTTRLIHVIGTLAGLWCAAMALVLRRPTLVVGAPLLGYGPAWYSHFRIERNRPASFGHPLWSARADFRLLSRYIRGTLEGDVTTVRGALGMGPTQLTLADRTDPSDAAA